MEGRKTRTRGADSERAAIIKKYYDLLMRLQKRYKLRAQSHSDIYGNNTITIYHYAGTEKRLVSKAEADDETDALRIAIRDLEHFAEIHSGSYGG